MRFIDPQYNELFRVPDGGVVQMTYPDGHQRSEVVEYLDDYHMTHFPFHLLYHTIEKRPDFLCTQIHGQEPVLALPF